MHLSVLLGPVRTLEKSTNANALTVTVCATNGVQDRAIIIVGLQLRESGQIISAIVRKKRVCSVAIQSSISVSVRKACDK